MKFWGAARLRSLGEAWRANHTATLNLAQTIGIIGSLAVVLWGHYRDANERSASFMLQFDQILDAGRSGEVATQLDEFENLDNFPLKGVAADEAIDDFLSNYELLNVAYEHQLISDDMAQDAFSWELEKAVNDRTIRRYISDSKAEEDDLFDGVLDLARAFGIKFPPIQPSKSPVVGATP